MLEQCPLHRHDFDALVSEAPGNVGNEGSGRHRRCGMGTFLITVGGGSKHDFGGIERGWQRIKS